MIIIVEGVISTAWQDSLKRADFKTGSGEGLRHKKGPRTGVRRAIKSKVRGETPLGGLKLKAISDHPHIGERKSTISRIRPAPSFRPRR